MEEGLGPLMVAGLGEACKLPREAKGVASLKKEERQEVKGKVLVTVM